MSRKIYDAAASTGEYKTREGEMKAASTKRLLLMIARHMETPVKGETIQDQSRFSQAGAALRVLSTVHSQN